MKENLLFVKKQIDGAMRFFKESGKTEIIGSSIRIDREFGTFYIELNPIIYTYETYTLRFEYRDNGAFFANEEIESKSLAYLLDRMFSIKSLDYKDIKFKSLFDYNIPA